MWPRICVTTIDRREREKKGGGTIDGMNKKKQNAGELADETSTCRRCRCLSVSRHHPSAGLRTARRVADSVLPRAHRACCAQKVGGVFRPNAPAAECSVSGRCAVAVAGLSLDCVFRAARKEKRGRRAGGWKPRNTLGQTTIYVDHLNPNLPLWDV